MSQIFISHSSKNNPAALALRDWLKENGWDENRVFLDIDPKAGISPGERWEKALQDAAARCEAVVFLISPEWLASRWCLDEFVLTRHLNKRIIGVVIEPVPLENIPAEMTREWQLCKLTEAGEATRFAPRYKGKTYAIKFSSAGLALLKIGLEKAGLAASTFAFKGGRSPYPGLRPLEEDDAAIFFGRSAEVIRALDELRGLREAGNKQLFVIQGASGTGKSSFLRAGLMARLRRDDQNFLVLPAVRPETAVLTGDSGLAASLATAAASLGLKFARGDIAKRLVDNNGFADILETLIAAAQKRNVVLGAQPPAVVLPIDQAEELFNPGVETEARSFLALLNTLKLFRGGVLAVATIRSDRYESLQSAEEISNLTQHPFNLPPIPPVFFSQIIEGPAERRTAAGMRLEIAPELTARMLNEIKGEGEAMPLIAFTMHQLFKNYGEDGMLDADEYVALGGIKGSIERAVAEACRDPGNTPAIPADAVAQERGLRRTFIPRLVRLDGAASTALRQIVVESELPAEVQAYTKRLVDQSVLTRNARAGLATVEIAHESVLRLWDRLKTWLTDEADNLKIREDIKKAATAWRNKNDSADYLIHTGSRLDDAEKLLREEDYRADLGDAEYYLRACRARADAEFEAEHQRLSRIARFLDLRTRAIAEAAIKQGDDGNFDSSLRLALLSGSFSRASSLDMAKEFAKLNLNSPEKGRTQEGSAMNFATISLARSFASSRHRLVLRGHDKGVTSVCFSADGTRVVTASYDTTARLWDGATGQGIAVLRGHNERVASANFSPDGMRVVTASRDKTARLWDGVTGQEIAVLRGHDRGVTSASFSVDGRRMVTASEDNTARLWDGATGQELAVLRGHEDKYNIGSTSFSPDGLRVVTASNDKTARLWDGATGQEIAVLRGHNEGVASANFSPDGTLVVTASSDNTARLWDGATGQEIAVLRGHDQGVASANFSPDGTLVVTASSDNTARLWDSATGQEIAVLRGHEGRIETAVFSPDGAHVVTASWDKTARLWDGATGKRIAVFRGHENRVPFATFSPDGRNVVTASWDNTARVWDGAAGQEMAVLRGHDDEIESAAFSPDGTRVVTASSDKTARLWCGATGKEIAVLRGHDDEIESAAFSPDGMRVVTASFDETARLWDSATGKKIAVLRGHESFVTSAAFSPDGMFVMTASADKTARLWDVARGRETAVLRGHEDVVDSVCFSADGRRAVTASRDCTARLWDCATGEEIAVLRGHENWIASAVFSPNDARVVTASRDGTARLWDGATGQEIVVLRGVRRHDSGAPTSAVIAVLRGHGSGVASATFSADGTRVVTASSDNTARLWDSATGKEIAVFRGHDDWVASATLSPDGTRVVTASFDKTARLWDSATGTEIVLLRGHENVVNSAVFSPDGTRVMTASSDYTARLWDVSLVTKRNFDDLATLACVTVFQGSTKPTVEELRLVGMDNEDVGDLCAPYASGP